MSVKSFFIFPISGRATVRDWITITDVDVVQIGAACHLIDFHLAEAIFLKDLSRLLTLVHTLLQDCFSNLSLVWDWSLPNHSALIRVSPVVDNFMRKVLSIDVVESFLHRWGELVEEDQTFEVIDDFLHFGSFLLFLAALSKWVYLLLLRINFEFRDGLFWFFTAVKLRHIGEWNKGISITCFFDMSLTRVIAWSGILHMKLH